jgi:hypothetical protein
VGYTSSFVLISIGISISADGSTIIVMDIKEVLDYISSIIPNINIPSFNNLSIPEIKMYTPKIFNTFAGISENTFSFPTNIGKAYINSYPE